MSLLAAFVLVPLVFMLAAIVAGRRGGHLIWLAAPAMAGLSVWLTLAIQSGPVGGALGGWTPPLGIALSADGFTAAFLIAGTLAAGLIGIAALGEFGPPKRGETARSYSFWPLFYALWAAVNAVFVSNDLFNLYVAIELATIAAVALTALGSVPAALRYLSIALLSSLAYLLGAVLLYTAYGTLDIGLLADRVEADLPTLLAAALMSAGLLAKTALFPLHAWLPPAHGAAPAPASALLSALVVKASFFILLRLWFGALPDLTGPAVVNLFGVLGAAAVLYGSLMALRQKKLKALIAYSTVAQLGYLFFVFPLAGGAALAAPWGAGAWNGMTFHALAHLFAKAGMFLAAGLMIHAVGDGRIAAVRGLAKAMPVTVFAFGLCAVSLMGLPPSGGFMAKYLMLISALAADMWAYAVVMVLGGVLAAGYLFGPLLRCFDRDGPGQIRPVPHPLLPAVPLALGILAAGLGVLSSGPYDFLQIAAPEAAEEGLTGGERE